MDCASTSNPIESSVQKPDDPAIDVLEPFRWDVLVPQILHPLKVVIIEALWWIGEPLSATDLSKVIDDEGFDLSSISYHMVKLSQAGAVVKVRERPVRGSLEKFYALVAQPRT